MTPRSILSLALFLASSCATVGKPDTEALKPTLEAFARGVRWKEFRGTADLIVPERREAFLKARLKAKDDQDLTISDFTQEDAIIAPDLQTARVVAVIKWLRMPNPVEQRATLTSVFVWREGRWLLESQDDGPFVELLPSPEKVPAPAPKPVAPSSQKP